MPLHNNLILAVDLFTIGNRDFVEDRALCRTAQQSRRTRIDPTLHLEGKPFTFARRTNGCAQS